MDEVDLYSRKILEITARLQADRRLEDPDCSHKKTSRVCGSTIEVDLQVSGGKVVAYGHEVRACALGQTSASVVEQNIVGSTFEELRQVRNEMLAMLKENGPPPTGKFAELEVLETVRDFTPRHRSIMLVFDAIAACLDEIENMAEAS